MFARVIRRSSSNISPLQGIATRSLRSSSALQARGPLSTRFRQHSPFLFSSPFDLFNNFPMEPGMTSAMKDFHPKIDITESEDSLHLSVECPGMDKGDLSITLEDSILTVSGEKVIDNSNKKEHYVERRSGHFSRSIRLPESVTENDISTKYHDGVLTVDIKQVKPVEKESTKKVIEIN